MSRALLSYGFELNLHDPCVANKMVNTEQLTIWWHVDDLKSSHIDPKVNSEFLQWIKTNLGNLEKSRQHEAHCTTILEWHLIAQDQDKSLLT